MKRVTMAAAALALMSSAAFAQQAPGQPGQPADAEQAARKGTINQPMAGPATGTTQVQPAPEDQSRQPGSMEPSKNTGNSGQK
jgi:hypothetical protein